MKPQDQRKRNILSKPSFVGWSALDVYQDQRLDGTHVSEWIDSGCTAVAKGMWLKN